MNYRTAKMRRIDRKILRTLIIFLYVRSNSLRRLWTLNSSELDELLRLPDELLLRKIRGFLYECRLHDIVVAYNRGFFSDQIVLDSVVRVIRRRGFLYNKLVQSILSEQGKHLSDIVVKYISANYA